ncbi:S8 family serine peptidase [Halobellus ordinarius]|uniref:S8 family serine peptidase n=1 Tax=Halobellus ordinarius TaxID=3075120 RepID=UPI0028800637|nr:S8 family serine peptidase [Halobellus sp. ZY16]
MGRWTSIGRRGFLSAAVGTAAAVGYAGTSGATVDPELKRRSGRVKGVVRLEPGPVDDARDSLSRERTLAELRRHADRTQKRIVDYVEATPGTEIRRRFWVANAVLVAVDTEVASFADLAALDGVDRVHRTDSGEDRQRPELDAPGASTAQTGGNGDVSYGLEMMNVPDVWERFDTHGEGATVAIIDTGVDPSHPDIDLAAWAEFDAEGKEVDSDPHDPAGHGTGMSSLATGGNASGTQIGVAPEAELLVARQSSEDYFTSALAALEWAVENGADAVSMSFDVGPLKHETIEAVANATAAGTVVVSAGYGPDSFLSPGALYSVLSAGAIDSERNPFRGGNGGEIRTERYWRSSTVPDDWPDRYTVPEVVTAGVDVLAAVPDNDEFDGGHTREDGYSNGPPHVSGVVALLRSLEGDLPPGEIQQILRETAEQPGDPHEHPDPNGDFGHGIVNAAAAAAEVRGRGREVSGAVTDPEGNPVVGATVSAVTGDTARTDEGGRYTLSVPEGEVTITAEAAGYEPVTRRAAPGSGVEIGFQSERRPDIQRAERPPTHVAPGDSVSLEFDVEHAEFATLHGRESSHLVDPSAVSVRINGDPAEIDQPTDITGETTLRIELDIDDGARGLIPASVSLANGEQNTTLDPDPIHVHERPLRAAEGEDLQAAVDVAAPETTVALAGDRWELPIESFESPLPESRFGNPIFDSTREDEAGLVVGKPITLAATEGHEPTLVARGGSGDRAFGVRIASHFATLRGIEVVAEGATGAVSVLDGDGVRLRNLTLSGATNGVSAQFTKSLVVRGCRIAASETGVALRDVSVNGLVRDTTVQDADQGVFLSGQVGERLFDVDATVTGNTFEGVGTDIDTEGTATITGENGEKRQLGGAPPGDSRLDLLLYAATAGVIGALFYPYGRRRLGNKR